MFWLRILVPAAAFTCPSCGGLFSAVLWQVGVRPDIASAMESVRFLFKFVITLTLAVAATGPALHLARPGDT